MTLFNAVMLMTAGAAMIYDFRTGRIPNVFIFVAAVTCLFCRILYAGLIGIPEFIAGAAMPAIFLFPLFCFRMMGAGDIKLLMCLGGIIGFPGILDLLLWSFAAGGILSVLRMICVTGFRKRLRYMFRYVRDFAITGQLRPYRISGERPENIPFAVPVFAAAVLVVLL